MSDFYTSAEWVALLAGIRADQDADLPRLVVADWLDDHGENKRAELIRLMILRRQSAGVSRQNGAMTNRCKSLVRQMWPWPAGGRPSYSGIMTTSPGSRRDGDLNAHGSGPANEVWLEYARGFVEQVECSAAAWVAHGDALMALEPVRRVTLTTRPGWSTNGVFTSFNFSPPANGAKREWGVWIWQAPWAAFEMPDDVDIPFRLLAVRWPGIDFRIPPMSVAE